MKSKVSRKIKLHQLKTMKMQVAHCYQTTPNNSGEYKLIRKSKLFVRIYIQTNSKFNYRNCELSEKQYPSTTKLDLLR